jgi:hypothetical protein
MSPEVLLVTAGVELGIVIGAAYSAVRSFIRDGRAMVMHAVTSLRSPI